MTKFIPIYDHETRWIVFHSKDKVERLIREAGEDETLEIPNIFVKIPAPNALLDSVTVMVHVNKYVINIPFVGDLIIDDIRDNNLGKVYASANRSPN